MNPPAARFNLARLRGGIKPFRLHWFPRLRSTNDHAAHLRRQGRLFAPAVVLTANQIAGRGRGANVWWSNPGVLTATFALPVQERLAPQELPLIAGLAVRQTAVLLTGNPHFSLKWPNDLLHDGRKVAGLLCERVSNADLVGVGLNVNMIPSDAPRSLRDQIASLSSIAGKPMNMTEALITLAVQLHHQVRRRMEQSFSVFVREYAQHDALIGKSVIVQIPGGDAPIAGKCQGVDPAGRLMVRQRGQLHHIVAGHVILNPGKARTPSR